LNNLTTHWQRRFLDQIEVVNGSVLGAI
jgi:hypothetical protein